jgi:predicted RNase H-like HicB family nuclease
MFEDIVGREKEKRKYYASVCSICNTTFRRNSYEEIFSVMSEHYVSYHGEIPKDASIIECTVEG